MAGMQTANSTKTDMSTTAQFLKAIMSPTSFCCTLLLSRFLGWWV